MIKLYHPTISDVSTEVEPGAVEAWQAQGWLKSAPKAAAAHKQSAAALASAEKTVAE